MALSRFVSDLKRAKIPTTLILVDRKNQWAISQTGGVSIPVTPFELGQMSVDEIESILDALDKHQALGKLTGTDRQYQRDHFEALAHKELLVALRELTSKLSSFDDIVRDEFQKIPSALAKQAYAYVSALGQLDLPIRFEVLGRLLNVSPEDLGRAVLQPTEGVLISLEDFGYSRHNAGYRVQARHPIIASVIFADAAPDDDTKFRMLTEIIEQLNPAFPEDARLLQEMVKRKELADTLASPAKRRALFDRLESVLPGNPYVLQHRSILERSLGDADAAIDYAKAALKEQPNDIFLKNTLGYAYESKARQGSSVESQAMLAQAEAIFEEGVRRQPSNPHNYLGMVQVIRTKALKEQDLVRRRLFEADVVSRLQEAFEQCNRAPELANALADSKARLGDEVSALKLLEDAVKSKPTDSRIRDALIRRYGDNKEFDKAKRTAEDGIKYDSTNWRLQRHLAMLLDRSGAPPESVKGHFEAAIRFRKGDPVLLSEFGAFLVRQGLLNDAKKHFSESRQLSMGAVERKRVNVIWTDGNGRRRLFKGRIHEIQGAMGFILSVPENFVASFWRTTSGLESLKVGDQVTFAAGFSAIDCNALDVRKA